MQSIRYKPYELTHSEELKFSVEQPKWEVAILCFFSFAIAIVVGYVLVFRYDVISGDAVSRVMNAYYVFFRGKMHFGAIGFIWQPFPSLLEMPIAAFHNVWPALVTQGFAGNIASSLFSAISTYYLHRILFRFGFSRLWRIFWCVLFILNPMILYYSSSGMTDCMLAGCLLAALSGILAYMEERRLEALSVGALWLAAAFMFRYEAIPFFFFTTLAIAICLWRLRQPRHETEAMIVLYAMPMIYSVIAWMFLNWLIMKNPLYFLVSPYGNLSQIGTGAYITQALSKANHNIIRAVMLSFYFSLLFFPSILGMGWAFIAQFRHKADPRWTILLFATIAIPIFQSVLMFENASGAWARYFIYFIPFGICLLAFIVVSFKGKLRTLAYVLCTGLFILGDYGTFVAQYNPILGHDETNAVVQVILKGKRTNFFYQEDLVSHFLNTKMPTKVVLIDTFDGWGIIPRLKSSKQCVITSDMDFRSVLANPRGRVDAILVPKPDGVDKLDAINSLYPGLWSGRLQWTRLIKEFPGPAQYKLYAVERNAP